MTTFSRAWWATWSPSVSTHPAAAPSYWTSSPTPSHRRNTSRESQWSSRAFASSKSYAKTCTQWWCPYPTAPAENGDQPRLPDCSAWCPWRIVTHWFSQDSSWTSHSEWPDRWPISWPRCIAMEWKRRSWANTWRTKWRTTSQVMT